jgi:hypothetical protein
MSRRRNRAPDLVTKLLMRILLRLATSRRIDGLWVSAGGNDEEAELGLCRVEKALGLIKTYDRRRYDRLCRDLERVWVGVVPGGLACFHSYLWICELDRRFVLDEATSAEVIAAAIVHEATHARLWRAGISYDEERRQRVEEVCFRRELAFAAKLPNGRQVCEDAEAKLLGYPASYWTDAAFTERSLDEHSEALRNLGVPDRIVRALTAVHLMRLRLRGHARPSKAAMSCPAPRERIIPAARQGLRR